MNQNDKRRHTCECVCEKNREATKKVDDEEEEEHKEKKNTNESKHA